MRTRALAAIAAAAISAGLLAGCSGAGSPDEATDAGPSGTLRANWNGFPTSWAPGAPMEPGYLRVPYETLVVLGEDGATIEPWLATEWTQTDTALTLKLREDVTFHDGTAFDAAAVKTNIEYVRDNPGQFSGALKVISDVEIVDEFTVKLDLARPTPSLLTTLTQRNVPIGSPKAIADGTIVASPVGTAPWRYDAAQSIPGTKMTFTLFDDYWGTMPGFANVELYGIADDTAATAALLSGELDVTATATSQLPTLEGSGDIETLKYPAIRSNIIFFDRGPGGVFADANLRKAVCYATNNAGYKDIDPAVLEITTQHFLEGEYGYDADIDGYPLDPAAATKAYTSAGSPALSAVFPAAPFNKVRSELYADSINKVLGTQLTVQELPAPQFIAEWSSGKYPLGIGLAPQLTPNDWYATWFAQDAGGNPAHVESTALKTAATKAIAAGISPEAEGLWKDVMKIIIDDEALGCAYLASAEILAWTTSTVSGIAQPTEPWEQNLINYRSVKPVG